ARLAGGAPRRPELRLPSWVNLLAGFALRLRARAVAEGGVEPLGDERVERARLGRVEVVAIAADHPAPHLERIAVADVARRQVGALEAPLALAGAHAVEAAEAHRRRDLGVAGVEA